MKQNVNSVSRGRLRPASEGCILTPPERVDLDRFAPSGAGA